MISPLSKLMDRAVEAHFRKDPGGRLVFVPFGLKQKCYFIDSKSDEEKIRALVKMYRSAFSLLSFLTSPTIYLSALIIDVFGGMTPRGHRLAIALGVPLIFWLVLVAMMFMLWGLYKQAVPSFTSSLPEVPPEAKRQLATISTQPRRIALVCAGACVLLLALVIFLVGVRRPSRATGTCPPQGPVTQRLKVDSSHPPCPQS